MNTRVYVFIDASNVWNVQKKKGFLFNYEKLIDYLKTTYKDNNMKVFYYTAYPEQDTRSYDTGREHAFYTYLKKSLKFIIRKKPLKRIKVRTPEKTIVKEKGDMDVELTIDVVHNIRKFDIAIFFTGDSDYTALLKHLQERDKHVYVYSSRNNISHELRNISDKYYEILNIKANIWGKKIYSPKNL